MRIVWDGLAGGAGHRDSGTDRDRVGHLAGHLAGDVTDVGFEFAAAGRAVHHRRTAHQQGCNQRSGRHDFYNIDFTNASSTACVLEGYPGVSLVSAGSEAGSQVGADARRTTTTPVHPVTIAGGQSAHAVLGVAEAGNFPAAKCDPVTAHWLKVFPPDQRAAAYISFTTQTCASTAQPTMTIAAITGGP